jgi:hypothetical protein
MALLEQNSRSDASAVLARAGLPRDAVAAWLEQENTLAGDYQRDVEQGSRRWRIGADLLALLPPKKARSDVQAAATAAILERERTLRQTFLERHVETLYRRLTHDFSKFKRVEELVRDAGAAIPGLLPDDKQLGR